MGGADSATHTRMLTPRVTWGFSRLVLGAGGSTVRNFKLSQSYNKKTMIPMGRPTVMARKTKLPAFVADKRGLEKILARRGKHFAVVELIQNALDENVTRVDVILEPNGQRGRHILRVEDDAPEGFQDIRHAYTLFAESNKKADPTKMGRFNLGEKLVVAACDSASITTTTGCVIFEGDGRTLGRKSTTAGSVFDGIIRMTQEEAAKTAEIVRQVLVPDGVKLIFNGDVIEPRVPIAEFKVILPTEIGDEEGYLRPTKRKTSIRVYEPRNGEVPALYEVALPVVEIGDQWHLSIGQKVPLNMDRDNVTPAFLRRVRMLVLNHMAERLPEDAAAASWVGEALGDPEVASKVVEVILAKRYGEKRVVRDPSDPEANNIAVSRGYVVIEPRSHTKAEWENIRRAGAALPAGQVTPSPKPYLLDGTPLKEIPENNWTDGMRQTVSYVRALGEKLIGRAVLVRIVDDPRWRFLATFGDGRLTLNKGCLSSKWFDLGPSEEVHELLIHEFSHHFSANHLSSEFHDACCQLGAKLTQLAMNDPAFFLSAASRGSS